MYIGVYGCGYRQRPLSSSVSSGCACVSGRELFRHFLHTSLKVNRCVHLLFVIRLITVNEAKYRNNLIKSLFRSANVIKLLSLGINFILDNSKFETLPVKHPRTADNVYFRYEARWKNIRKWNLQKGFDKSPTCRWHSPASGGNVN